MILSRADGLGRMTITAGIAGTLETREDKSALPRDLITQNEKPSHLWGCDRSAK